MPRALHRYMRERGGAVVVVPDQRIEAGPARDLVSSESVTLSERLLEQPAKLTMTSAVASLQASELLIAPHAATRQRRGGACSRETPLPVVVSMPRGRRTTAAVRRDGRLALSRRRQRRLRSILAVDHRRARAGGAAADRDHRQSAAAAPRRARRRHRPRPIARRDGGQRVARRRQPIRLLPEPETGVYRGRFVAKNTPGHSTLEVRIAAAQSFSTSRAVPIRSDVRRLDRSGFAVARDAGLVPSRHRRHAGPDCRAGAVPSRRRHVHLARHARVTPCDRPGGCCRSRSAFPPNGGCGAGAAFARRDRVIG